MTKYDPRKNAEGYNDPTPYAAEKHMMAQIRGKQARVAGGYFENIISASCDYYLSRGLAKIEKTPEPMKPLGAKNRKGQFLACYTNLDLFLKLLRTVKRRSSWLDAILICLTGEMFLYSGMAVRDHTQEVHVMGSDEIHIYHAAVVHDNNRETVSIGTDAAVISD